jgi:probable rRNA maturation factor
MKDHRARWAKTEKVQAQRQERKSVVAVDVALELRPGAPAAPTLEQLTALFERAWAIVPPTRRPKLRGATKLAVDLHVIPDAEIAALNHSHMKHSGPTDVLSFPMGEVDPERGAFHLGEVVVSYETAQREAAARKLTYEEELARYCVHGFLHLLGYEDDTPAQRREMHGVQEKALSAWMPKPS